MSASAQPAPQRVPNKAGATWDHFVCSRCGVIWTEPHACRPTSAERLRTAVSALETLQDPAPFAEGVQAAHEAVLAFLDTLPESLANRTRDHGRGVAYAVSLLGEAVAHSARSQREQWARPGPVQ